MKKKKDSDYTEFSNNDEGYIIESEYPQYEAEQQNTEVALQDELFVSEENTDSLSLSKTTFFDKFKGIFKNKKLILISGISLFVIAALTVSWLVITSLWRNGKTAMPTFAINMGLLQGNDFRYSDDITVNGVDISGLSVKKAKSKIEKNTVENVKDLDITVNVGEQSFKLGSEDISYEIDADSALDEAKTFCIDVMKGKVKKEKKDFAVSLIISQESKTKITDKAKESVYKEPVDATFDGISDGSAHFTEEINGYSVDENNLIEVLSDFLKKGNTSGNIEVASLSIPAKITKADLEEKITLLATHSTTSTSTAAGSSNMKKALEMCNGSIIKPGEVWSFNACTGNSNLEKDGWKKAVVYVNGRQDYGVGGGICQASTTIYNAALMSNLGIQERHYHLWAPGYAKAGLDATIDYPNLDLKLKNNTDYPIYLECYMKGNKLTANFYGYHTDNYDKITLKCVETERVAGEYFKISSSRSLWKDGNLVTTDALPLSKYSLKKKLWVGEEENEPDTETDTETGNNTENDTPNTDLPEVPPETDLPEENPSEPSGNTGNETPETPSGGNEENT